MLNMTFLPDILRKIANIPIIERRINLIHKIKGKLPNLLTGKNQRQRRQRLLPPTQQVNLFPRLLLGSDRKLGPLKRVHRVGHAYLRVTASQMVVNVVDLAVYQAEGFCVEAAALATLG